jgi:ferric-dicitrate binding protein FerR (iron transport regulator)
LQSTPISDVARELERRFGVQVRVADAAVATRTVTAWFTNENLEQVLLIVCRAADARCLIRDRTVSIEP